MWDQQIINFIFPFIDRIIPTYVGSTPAIVHSCASQYESFPRMWDQRLRALCIHLENRIIPTYVGSTL